MNGKHSFGTVSSLCKYARDYGRQTVKKYDMADSEHQICMYLYYHKGVSQDDVAQNLMMDKTTVAKALRRLEAKNHVAREIDPSNRRKKCLCLLPEAYNLVNNLVNLYDGWADKVFECLTKDEQEEFDKLCTRLCACAKKISEDSKNE